MRILVKLARMLLCPRNVPLSLRPILPLTLLVLAGACTPVDDSRLSTSPSNNSNYEVLSSTANTTSTLGGVALKFRSVPTSTTLTTTSGTLNHATGATTINDGTYTLVDPDGYAANGALSDGTSNLISTSAQGFTGNYEYARVYTQTYFVSKVPYIANGIYGVVTADADMPSTGTAVFNGEAQGSFFNNRTNFDLNKGKSQITADFAKGNVDVEMNGFTIVNRDTKVSANVGFNSVKITGMRVFGNQFSGGAISTQRNGATVQVINNSTQQNALGRFFGLTSAGVPDEAGGIGYLKGSDGTLTTIFLAD